MFFFSIFNTFLIRPFYYHNDKWERVYVNSRNFILFSFKVDYYDYKAIIFEEDEWKGLKEGFRTKDITYSFDIIKYMPQILDWLVWINSALLLFSVSLNFYSDLENNFYAAAVLFIIFIFFIYLFKEFWKEWYDIYKQDVTYYIGDFFHDLKKFEWLFYFVHLSIFFFSFSLANIQYIVFFFYLDLYISEKLDIIFYLWVFFWIMSTYLFFEKPKNIKGEEHTWFSFFFKVSEIWLHKKFLTLKSFMIRFKKWAYRIIFLIFYYHYYYYINWIFFFIAVGFLLVFIFYREK